MLKEHNNPIRLSSTLVERSCASILKSSMIRLSAYIIREGIEYINLWHRQNPLLLLSEYSCLDYNIGTHILHTLSGRICKVVASHAQGCRVDSRLRLHRFILCTRRSESTAHEVGVALSETMPIIVSAGHV